ncbi:MAG: hypothetical protein KGY78_08580, partial [Anaerolineae bacterium]|nr:hypothetical protein [Anaerolineae bacterium]
MRTDDELGVDKPVHEWLCSLRVSFVPGPRDAVLDQVAEGLLDAFRQEGHTVQPTPNDYTDVILTTAQFGEPLNWREALLFTARRRFDLTHAPTIYTLVHITPDQLDRTLGHLQSILPKSPPDPTDYEFAGMADGA